MDVEKLITGFQIGFGVIGIIISLMFILMTVVWIVIGGNFITETKKNNRSARITVYATVLEKRSRYSRNINSMRSAVYYVTFEVESGDRMVLNISERDFSLLIEGDQGMLTFQGKRFCDFKRKCMC